MWYKKAQEQQLTEQQVEEPQTEEAQSPYNQQSVENVNLRQIILKAKKLIGNNKDFNKYIDNAASQLHRKGITFNENDVLKEALKLMKVSGTETMFKEISNIINRILDSAPMASIEDLNKRRIVV